MNIWIWFIIFLGVGYTLAGLRIIRPMERGLIEFFGKYKRFAKPGLQIVWPFVYRLVKVDITENMVDAQKQEIITKDKLNASVDAQVYFKVRSDSESVASSQYNVANYEEQIVQLARTTLRDIIGTLSLTEANSGRGKINDSLMKTLSKETHSWGIDIVRTELKEIEPPENVQGAMNQVVIAENDKIAAKDFANAVETEADGRRRAAIKEAAGLRQASILKAEGQAKAFDLINKSFVENAQLLKRYEVTQASLQNNTKIVLTEKGIDPVIVFGDAGPIIPLKKK